MHCVILCESKKKPNAVRPSIVESDNAPLCSDHFVKRAFCGFVYVRLQEVSVSKLCNMTT